MTFVAALRIDRIDAPCVLDRQVNRVRFLAYVSQFLVPTWAVGMIAVARGIDFIPRVNHAVQG